MPSCAQYTYPTRHTNLVYARHYAMLEKALRLPGDPEGRAQDVAEDTTAAAGQCDAAAGQRDAATLLIARDATILRCC